MPGRLFPTSEVNGFTWVFITLTSMSLGIVVALSFVAQQLLFCLHILSRMRYHEFRLLECSMYGLSYHAREGDTGIMCSLGRLRLSLRFPTPSNPEFCKVELCHIRYCGPWASGCCSNLTASVRLPGPDAIWCTARIDDLRLTVRNSEHIPDAIARLRENLLRTIVLGDVQKLEHFASAANTGFLWSGEGLGVVSEARGYEVTISGRMYEFGRLKGSLVRNWDTEEGRLMLEGENVQWYKLHSDSSTLNSGRIFTDILSYPATLFSSLVSASQNPALLLDLSITHGEVKFRKFRDRDNALGTHAMQLLGEWKPQWINASFLHGFMGNAVYKVLAGGTPTPSTLDKYLCGEHEETVED